MPLCFSKKYIQEIIDRNDIVEYVSQKIALMKNGKNFKGSCPFHKQSTPSFSVSSDKQMFYCFGCGKGGNIIEFVKSYEQCSFVDAIEILAERCGMDLPSDKDKRNKYEYQKRKQLYLINSAAAEFYHKSLKEGCSGEVKEYIARRQAGEEIINSFAIGYATGGNSLLEHLKAKGFSAESILASGLVRKAETGKLYDRFSKRLMFPIYNAKGTVASFGGRTIEVNTSAPKYLNSPETEIFRKRECLFGLNIAKRSKEDYFVLTEGYMDALQLHQHGIDCAIATLGTALTPEQVRLIKRYKGIVVIAYDSDQAGKKATLRAIELLEKEGIRCLVLTLPECKDPDEYLKLNGKDAFINLVKSASSPVEYKIELLKDKYDLCKIEQRAEFVISAARILAKVKSPVKQELYIRKLSEETGVSVQSICKEIMGMNN